MIDPELIPIGSCIRARDDMLPNRGQPHKQHARTWRMNMRNPFLSQLQSLHPHLSLLYGVKTQMKLESTHNKVRFHRTFDFEIHLF